MKTIPNDPPAYENPDVYLCSRQNNYGNYDTMRTADDEATYCEGSLALILRLCRCAGVAPLRASRAGAGWRFRVSPPLAVLQRVVMTIINLTLITSSIITLYIAVDYQSRFGGTIYETFIWLLDAALIQVTASLVIYRGAAEMESLRRVIHLQQQIKSDLSIGGSKTERIKCVAMVIMLLWMAALMLAEFGVYCIILTSSDEINYAQIFYGVSYISYIIDLQGMMAVVKWSCTVLEAHHSASALNQYLERLQLGGSYEYLGSSEQLNGSVEKAETVIQRLTLTYKRISDMMRQMNDTNGLFLTVILLSTFLRFVVTLYYLVFEHEHVSAIPLGLGWILIHLTVLTLIIEPCHWTHSQREYTAILLGELIAHQTPNRQRLSSEFNQFAKQVMLNNTKFSAFGVYTLDRQLTAAILGGVTTYLIILIQTHSS